MASHQDRTSTRQRDRRHEIDRLTMTDVRRRSRLSAILLSDHSDRDPGLHHAAAIPAPPSRMARHEISDFVATIATCQRVTSSGCLMLGLPEIAVIARVTLKAHHTPRPSQALSCACATPTRSTSSQVTVTPLNPNPPDLGHTFDMRAACRTDRLRRPPTPSCRRQRALPVWGASRSTRIARPRGDFQVRRPACRCTLGATPVTAILNGVRFRCRCR